MPDLPPPRPLQPRETPREARSRAVVETLLAIAAAGSLLALATAPGAPPAAPGIRSIPVDVAHDGPGRLRLLPGLGATRVAAILADRRAHGPAQRVEDLSRVRGIG